MHRNLAALGLLALVFASRPASAELTAADLEGYWLAERYIAALEQTHSLLRASQIAPPVTFTIGRSGDGWRMSVGNFHEATWNAIASVEAPSADRVALVIGPYETPAPTPTETKRLTALVARGSSGRVERLQMTLWGEENAWFRRIDVPAEQFVNAMLLAGTWHDLNGGSWSFDAAGNVKRPDGNVARFSPSIDTSEACCDYITVDGARTGFALRDGTLWLYRSFEDPEGCPISCDRSAPMRILVRDVAGDTSNPAALWQLNLTGLTSDGTWWTGAGRSVAFKLQNPGGAVDPQLFPDTAVMMFDRVGSPVCDIAGGIWSRDGFWLSADEKLIATLSHSGSSSELSIYRTRDCTRTATVAVDARSLRIDADRIEHAGVCEPYGNGVSDCTPAAVWRIRRDGGLEHLAEESARLTRGVFGTPFSARSDIESPRTDRAKVVPPGK